MKILLIIASAALIFSSCEETSEILYPDYDPSDLLAHAEELNSTTKDLLEGVYAFSEGNNNFGDQAVLKWNRKNLSVFTHSNAGYMVLEGGIIDSIIILKGFWRHQLRTNHGTIEIIISPENGGADLLNGVEPDSLILSGSYSDGNIIPSKKIKLKFQRRFSSNAAESEFFPIAHRGGGRNSDLLGASENTIEMISRAESMGASGVEIDVRSSSDGIPFLYHDPDINLRLTLPGVLHGQIEDYTYAQIKTFITLTNRERIPSLEKALEYILYDTELKLVWLDLKSEKNDLAAILNIRSRIKYESELLGREIEIFLGIPEDYKAEQLKTIPNYRDIPTICELGPDKVRELNSRIWAPRWTEGLQTERVLELQNEGKKVFVWTLDEEDFIRQYINEGNFDGILSNYTPLVAYYHYTK